MIADPSTGFTIIAHKIDRWILDLAKVFRSRLDDRIIRVMPDVSLIANTETVLRMPTILGAIFGQLVVDAYQSIQPRLVHGLVNASAVTAQMLEVATSPRREETEEEIDDLDFLRDELIEYLIYAMLRAKRLSELDIALLMLSPTVRGITPDVSVENVAKWHGSNIAARLRYWVSDQQAAGADLSSAAWRRDSFPIAFRDIAGVHSSKGPVSLVSHAIYSSLVETSNRVLTATAEANSDLVDGEFWVASLERTCQRCLALHGRLFPFVNGKSIAPRPPLHANCNCMLIPHIAGSSNRIDPPGEQQMILARWLKRQRLDSVR